MTNNTSSVRFNYDFFKKTIVGTKASFDKASKGFGPAYVELAAKMAEHPDFTCVVKEPKKPAKPKQTYKGMDIPFMVDYLTAINDSTTLKTLNDVIDFAEKAGRSKYPLAKRVLFDAYECFDYVEAKRVVDDSEADTVADFEDHHIMASAVSGKKYAETNPCTTGLLCHQIPL